MKFNFNHVTMFLLLIINLDMFYNFYESTHGQKINMFHEKKCAKKWILNSINSGDFMLQINANFENLIKEPTIKLKLMLAKLLPCINNVNVYKNNRTKNKNAIAYVMPILNKKKMWVVSKHWDTMVIEERTYTLIHECTHLALDTKDYAYWGEDKYSYLRGYNATHNADSISKIISNINIHC